MSKNCKRQELHMAADLRAEIAPNANCHPRAVRHLAEQINVNDCIAAD